MNWVLKALKYFFMFMGALGGILFILLVVVTGICMYVMRWKPIDSFSNDTYIITVYRMPGTGLDNGPSLKLVSKDNDNEKNEFVLIEGDPDLNIVFLTEDSVRVYIVKGYDFFLGKNVNSVMDSLDFDLKSTKVRVNWDYYRR